MMPDEGNPGNQGRDEEALEDARLHGAAPTIDDVASVRVAECLGDGTIVPPHLKTDQAAMEGAVHHVAGPGLETH